MSAPSTSSFCPGVASYETNNDTNQRLEFAFRHPNGTSQIWIGGKDGCVRVYDCQSQQLVEKIEIEHGGVDCSQAINGVSLFNPSQSTKSLLAVSVGSRQFPTESYWGMDEEDHSNFPSGGAESIRIYEVCQKTVHSATRGDAVDVLIPTTTKNNKKVSTTSTDGAITASSAPVTATTDCQQAQNSAIRSADAFITTTTKKTKKKITTNTDSATKASSTADAATNDSSAPITATCTVESTVSTLPSTSARSSREHETTVAASDAAAASKKATSPTIEGDIAASLQDETYLEIAKQPAKEEQIKSEDVDDVVVRGTDKSPSAGGKSKDPEVTKILSDGENAIQSSPEFKFVVNEATTNYRRPRESMANQRESMATRLDKEFQDVIELDKSSDEDVQVLSPGKAAKARSSVAQRTGTGSRRENFSSSKEQSSDDDIQVLSPGKAAKARSFIAQRTGPKCGDFSPRLKATSKKARASPSKESKLTDNFSPSQSPTSRMATGRPSSSSNGRSSLSSDSNKKPAAAAVSRGNLKPPPPSSALSSRSSDGHDGSQPQGRSRTNCSSFAASILHGSKKKENNTPTVRVKSDPSRNSPQRRRRSSPTAHNDGEGKSKATAICID